MLLYHRLSIRNNFGNRSILSGQLRWASSIRRLQGKRVELFSASYFRKICNQFDKVHFDIGTGNARFVYNLAKENSEHLYIGIDSNCDRMGLIAWKIKRKPSRGGLVAQNLELLHMSIEDIPDEFSNMADFVTINYPWGSLLKGITDPDPRMIETISKISHVNAEIVLNFNYTLYSDKTLIDRLSVQDLTQRRVLEKIKACFFTNNLHCIEQRVGNNSHVKTEWGQHLTLGSGREVLSLKFCRG